MPALILRKDGLLEAVECPDGRRPESVAEEHGAELVDYCDSMGQARWRIANMQGTKFDSI
jgi:hypothetical protein